MLISTLARQSESARAARIMILARSVCSVSSRDNFRINNGGRSGGRSP